MGIISRAADTYYTFRFLKTMTTKWTDMEAYKRGIVDENGKVLKKGSQISSEDKSHYTLFHRLVFNIKRILEKLPFGKTKLASYAAALFLLKEETNLSQEQIKEALEQIMQDLELDLDMALNEDRSWNVMENDQLAPGNYSLSEDIASPKTGEIIARKGTSIIADANNDPVDYMYGTPIYKVRHIPTQTDVYVAPGDLVRWSH